MVLQMNQYAARAHRSDFIDVLRSKLNEFFAENPAALKQI